MEKPKAVAMPVPIRRSGLMLDIPKQDEPLPEAKPAKAEKSKAEKVKHVCDGRLANAARELRDRWLEQVNGRGEASMLEASGKYDVSKAFVA